MPLDRPELQAKPADASLQVIDLQAGGLAKRFGAAPPVFAGLDFAIRRGECVALVGANGTGKSTLLRCCLGLIAPMPGRFRCWGKRWPRLTARRGGPCADAPGWSGKSTTWCRA
ncbi:ATP-binding cassette domain-containing protein [Frigidibacter mobilis]|uniref:ABC transporter n=1 Tax=Frigidibacter mobilis TaxID=1335048 RepID=A0A159Z5P9_9RHOB|nr:ATP-binding cassette domain-containing protein [Frigidibacter mobilis]AMY70586.1 ABC transporter [Frigidibacter mobilis]